MTIEDLKQKNFMYQPILFSERVPELNKYVPCIDDEGEIIIYRRTEHGYNMRDNVTIINTNKPLICWLEKKPIFDDEEKDLLIKILEHNPNFELKVTLNRETNV